MFGKMKETLRLIETLKPFFGLLEEFKDAVFLHITKGTPLGEEVCIAFIVASEALLEVLKGESDNGGKDQETSGETSGE